MTIQMKGPEGALARIREIQDQLNTMIGGESGGVMPKPNAVPSNGSFANMLEGKIGKPNGELAPMDPMAAGFGRLPVGGKAEILSMVRDAAAKHGVDAAMFQALVQQESDFNPRSLSGAGAMGLAQLMPGTARALGVSDPYDPRQNLDGGARYLAQMLKQFGDPKLALAAYNAGPGAVKRAGGMPDIAETRNYVAKVMANADKLRSGGIR